MQHHRDPSEWAAARTIGTLSQLLVSQLTQASTAEQVVHSIQTSLRVFASQAQEGITINGFEARDSQEAASQDMEQCIKQLQQHAAVLGWGALQAVFFQDQFNTWACAVLAGVWTYYYAALLPAVPVVAPPPPHVIARSPTPQAHHLGLFWEPLTHCSSRSADATLARVEVYG
jgi:hypothetical protein